MEEKDRNLEQRIKDHFDVAMEQSKEHFGLLSEQIKGVSEKVELLSDDMDVIKSDIIDIKRDIKEMKVELKIKADKEIVENQETRITKLENVALAKR